MFELVRVHGNHYFWTKLCRNIKEDWVENRNHPLPPPFKDPPSQENNIPQPTYPSAPQQFSPASVNSLPPTASSSPSARLQLPTADKASSKSCLSSDPKTRAQKTVGFLSKMFKPVRNLVPAVRPPRRPGSEFSNVLFSDQTEGSIVRLIDSAPGRTFLTFIKYFLCI